MTNLSNLTILAILVAIGGTVIGFVQGEKWSYNPWLGPVLVALAWGITQDRK
jgi:hypothetical protein